MKRKHHSRILLLSLVLLILSAGGCFGATWYVATDGNDSTGNGSSSAPFQTIQHAVNTADNGDTILVEAGTYYEDVTVNKNRLTLRSLTTLGATIDGTDFAIQLTGNGLTVEDFSIENSSNGIGVYGDQTEDVTFSSNWFSGIANDGIYFYWDAEVEGCTVTMEDNVIYSSGAGIFMQGIMGDLMDVDIRILDNFIDGPSDGIRFNYLNGGSVEISDNSLYDCETNGIYVDTINPDGGEISCKIENNDIDLSGNDGSYGIYMYNAERTTWIKGNTITGDYDAGIYVGYSGYYGKDPLLLYVDENEIGGCEYGIQMRDLFEDVTGSIYLQQNVIYSCNSGSWGDGDGIYLEYVGSGIGIDGFNLYCYENTILECEDDGLELGEIFSGSTGEIYIQSNSFLDNSYGLYISAENQIDGSILAVETNNFEGNIDYGLLNETGALIYAPNNWWGDATGPEDTKSLPGVPDYNNPAGLGDPVSAYIDYKPWRETPYIPGEDSSGGGCNTGGYVPGLIMLVLPLFALIRSRKNI